MSDRTHYPPGDCVGCGQPAATMPLCVECRAVWEHDGDTWADNSDYAVALRAAANRELSAWKPLSYCLCNHSQLAHNIPANEEAPDQYGPRCVICNCVGFERDVLGYDLSVGAQAPKERNT